MRALAIVAVQESRPVDARENDKRLARILETRPGVSDMSLLHLRAQAEQQARHKDRKFNGRIGEYLLAWESSQSLRCQWLPEYKFASCTLVAGDNSQHL